MTALLAASEVIKYRAEVEKAKRIRLRHPKPTSIVTLGSVPATDKSPILVTMRFYRPVEFVNLHPEQARELATGLLAWANEVERLQVEERLEKEKV